MGRKKLEIKRIEDKNSRQVTFTKRRNGLFKKAKDLGILCDVQVAVLISSARGKLYHFSNTNSCHMSLPCPLPRLLLVGKFLLLGVCGCHGVSKISLVGRNFLRLTEILQLYCNQMEEEANVSAEHSVMAKDVSKYASFITVTELLGTIERLIEEPNVEQLSMNDLLHLEKQLESALLGTRSRQTHLMMETKTTLEEKEKVLREENELLKEEIATRKNNKSNEMNAEITNQHNQMTPTTFRFI